MELIRVETDNGVAVLRLDHGVINALSPRLLSELEARLAWVRDEETLGGLVLASANDKFFSIGFNLPELLDLNRDAFAGFYQTFCRVCLDLYTLPKPVAAAITGHATAGGCILALCCDYRFIAEGRRLMGLNEILLGVPVPYLADCVLEGLVGPQVARQVAYGGDFNQPDTLLAMGLVDEVLPLPSVLPRAVSKVRNLAALPREAFAAIKTSRVEVVTERVRAHQAEKAESFLDCWYSEPARERLRAAAARF